MAQKFVSCAQVKKRELFCKISKSYQKLKSFDGVYCLLNGIPSVHNKFIVEDYDSIKGLFSQSQKNYIHSFVALHKTSIIPSHCSVDIEFPEAVSIGRQ